MSCDSLTKSMTRSSRSAGDGRTGVPSRRTRLGEQAGLSLIEVLIGVVILTVALLGLAAAGGVAARQVYQGRTEMHRWAALQQQLETLVSQGYENVTSGADTVQGYPIEWTVSGTNPKRIDLIIEREAAQRSLGTKKDTTVFYLADPTGGGGS